MTPAEIEAIMKLMKEHGVTSLKYTDLEMAMPLVHQPAEDKPPEPSDDDLLFYSSDQ